MRVELHRSGRWRTWLGARFGGDFALGDRIWRRVLHVSGSVVLVYYVLPPNFFLVPNWVALIVSMLAVVSLEVGRGFAVVDLPTIRAHEAKRPASFVFFAVGLVAAVLIFPLGIAVAIVLGTALVDPLIGELRLRSRSGMSYPVVPLVVYGIICALALRLAGQYPLSAALASAAIATPVAIAVEYPKYRMFDDDLFMTLVPGAVLWGLALWMPAVFG